MERKQSTDSMFLTIILVLFFQELLYKTIPALKKINSSIQKNNAECFTVSVLKHHRALGPIKRKR